jgi:hypothetical protein
MTGVPESGSVAVSTRMPQPTPQYEHAVLVTAMNSWSAAPVPVGFRRRYREENRCSPGGEPHGEHHLRRSGRRDQSNYAADSFPASALAVWIRTNTNDVTVAHTCQTK